MDNYKLTYLKPAGMKQYAITGIFIVLAAFFTVGCFSDAEQVETVDGVYGVHALQDFSDCNDFESYAKEAAIELLKVRLTLQEGEDDTIIIDGDTGGDGDSDGDADDDDDDADNSDSESDENGDIDQSSTNTQEADVDEADLVKTDGDYIYTLHNGQLQIVAADPQGNLEQSAIAEVGGYAKELFIFENTAVVFSNLYENDVPSELSHMHDINFTGDLDCWDHDCFSASYAQMAILDITDKANPEVLRTVIYAGTYKTARRVDNSVRMIVYSPIPALEMVWDDDIWEEDQTWEDAMDALILSNEERISSLSLEEILPRKLDSAVGTVEPITDCNSVVGPITPTGVGLTTIVSIDLTAPLQGGTQTSVFGAQSIVYASSNALYLATPRRYAMDAFISGLWEQQLSGIHKFNIARSDSAAYYQGSGDVPGYLLDQFCMGEKDGYLRVATTTGNRWEEETLENHVLVLTQQENHLATVGQLDGLGKGEEIYAARFKGDRGFLVTYFEQDPLYTLDMSDPTSPKAVGEWHGPGYSTYLHPLGDNHILSFGEEDWDPVISLYDVSDFANPALVEREFLDFYTEAIYEHKAITFNAKNGFFAIPHAYYWEEDSESGTGITMYTVDTTGIEKTGRFALNAQSEGYESNARRSVYLGETIFGISRCRITSAPMNSTNTILDTIALFSGTDCDDWGDGGGDIDWD